jgi:hypothetical protein
MPRSGALKPHLATTVNSSAISSLALVAGEGRGAENQRKDESRYGPEPRPRASKLADRSSGSKFDERLLNGLPKWRRPMRLARLWVLTDIPPQNTQQLRPRFQGNGTNSGLSFGRLTVTVASRKPNLVPAFRLQPVLWNGSVSKGSPIASQSKSSTASW